MEGIVPLMLYRGPPAEMAPEPHAGDAAVAIVDILMPPEAEDLAWFVDMACWNVFLRWEPPPERSCPDAAHANLVVPDPIEQDGDSGLFA
jgi:hypothetical protein